VAATSYDSFLFLMLIREVSYCILVHSFPRLSFPFVLYVVFVDVIWGCLRLGDSYSESEASHMNAERVLWGQFFYCGG